MTYSNHGGERWHVSFGNNPSSLHFVFDVYVYVVNPSQMANLELDLNQVMWAISVRVNPAGDVLMLPNLAENLLDPACQPSGMVQKMIIDATTPVAPDFRGDYGELLQSPIGTDAWLQKLESLTKELRK